MSPTLVVSRHLLDQGDTMICGHCRQSHSSVGEVKACSLAFRYSNTGTQVTTLQPQTMTTESLRLAEFDVPASNYALVVDGVLRFYRVEVPTRGKWKGFRFTKRLIGHPGDWAKYPLTKEQSLRVLSLIVNDRYDDGDLLSKTSPLFGAKAAALRFSRKFTQCAVCLSPLSDPESVRIGFGPVCVKKF